MAQEGQRDAQVQTEQILRCQAKLLIVMLCWCTVPLQPVTTFLPFIHGHGIHVYLTSDIFRMPMTFGRLSHRYIRLYHRFAPANGPWVLVCFRNVLLVVVLFRVFCLSKKLVCSTCSTHLLSKTARPQPRSQLHW